jgi:hypothetical protein
LYPFWLSKAQISGETDLKTLLAYHGIRYAITLPTYEPLGSFLLDPDQPATDRTRPLVWLQSLVKLAHPTVVE